MAGRFSLDVVFRAVDRISAPVRKMQTRVTKFTRSARVGFRKLNAQVTKFGRALRTAALGATVALLPLGGAVADVVRTGATFEQTITNAAAKFGIMDKNAEGAKEQLDAIIGVARKLGATTEFTASAAAEGLNFLAFAGFTAQQSVAALPGLIDLATASQTDLATATDIATDSLGAFGMFSDDATVQAANLTKISDAMAKTTITANTNMEMLMETVKNAAPDFISAGQSMETFLASAGLLANAGIKGGDGGTKLKNAILRLSAPAPRASKLLKNLGVDVADADDNMRDFVDILADLEKGLIGVGSQRRSAILNEIFGKRAITGINVLLRAGTKRIRDYRTQLELANGTTKEMAAFMRDTLQGRMKETVSAFESLKLTIFELKNTALNSLTESLTEFVRKLESTIFANKTFAGSFIDGLVQAVTATIKIFGLLIGTFIAFKLTMLATGIIAGTMVLGINLMTGAVIAFNIAIKAARIAVAIFNAIFALSPFGAIALAVGLVIAALVGLAFYWDDIQAKVIDGIQLIANALKTIANPFKELFSGAAKLFNGGKILFGFEKNPFSNGVGPLAPDRLFAAGLPGENQTDAGAGTGPQVVSPEDRTARNIEERREHSTAEVTIRAGEGVEAEVTAGRVGPGVTLSQSGAF